MKRIVTKNSSSRYDLNSWKTRFHLNIYNNILLQKFLFLIKYPNVIRFNFQNRLIFHYFENDDIYVLFLK